IKAPKLPATYNAGSSVPAIFRLLGLDLALMLVFVGGLGLATALGFEMPENINNTLTPTLATAALIVIVAPIIEELVFRSWLAGHPAVLAVVPLCVGGFWLAARSPDLFDDPIMVSSLRLLGLSLALVAAPTSAFLLLRKPVPDLFIRRFAIFFWISSLAFSLYHIQNYTDASWSMLVIILPLVLPQFVLGTMLGYLRVHYGLIPAIALHAAHNAILFGLAILGGLGETPAAGS
ncbi:MAG: CPBP family intramembrane metalloprotease, partial [Erythrobacter sp.]|nr:CPBP family intramembrane metalloprotease [Erythrobacter sp.]